MATSEQQPSLAELALRGNSPDTWEEPDRPEFNFEVASRLCSVLGLSRITDDMLAVSILEADRQEMIYGAWRSTVRDKEERDSYRRRMGEVALGLVDALVPSNDPRDRDVLVESVLDALKPIDDRLVSTEWDGVIR